LRRREELDEQLGGMPVFVFSQFCLSHANIKWLTDEMGLANIFVAIVWIVVENASVM
jgi:hypothetical protein